MPKSQKETFPQVQEETLPEAQEIQKVEEPQVECPMVAKARRELEIAFPNTDEMQQLANKCILELMQTLSSQGHSGFSVGYVMRIFNKLSAGKTLSPLTGEGSEWNRVDMEGLSPEGGESFQNLRDSSVFMDIDAEGKTTYRQVGAMRFYSDGSWVTCGDSSLIIDSFPFTPVDLYFKGSPLQFKTYGVELRSSNIDAIRAIIDEFNR